MLVRNPRNCFLHLAIQSEENSVFSVGYIFRRQGVSARRSRVNEPVFSWVDEWDILHHPVLLCMDATITLQFPNSVYGPFQKMIQDSFSFDFSIPPFTNQVVPHHYLSHLIVHTSMASKMQCKLSCIITLE